MKQKFAFVVYEQGNADGRSVQLHRETFEAKEALLGPDHLDTLLTAEALSMALLESQDPEISKRRRNWLIVH
jgi:hypothetical protein